MIYLPVTPGGRPLGRKPPRVPHHTLAVHRSGAELGTLPSIVDFRSLCPPVWDQGQQGSCTAHALAGGVAVLSQRAINAGLWKGALLIASRAAIYFGERSIEGDTGQDAGANLADGLSVVASGIVPEADCPYNDAVYDVAPSVAAVAAGETHAVTNAEPIALDLQTILGTLAQGYPVVCGIIVYPSFESAADGNIPLPGAQEQALGGHAVVIVGYDQVRRVLIGRNSWSASWGDGGYFYLPFDYAANSALFDEAYAMRALR